MSKKSLYLIHPRSDHLGWFGGEAFGGAGVADSALPVVASLASEYFDVTICDERIQEVDRTLSFDFVGITGKHGQGPRMLELARGFRARGIPVIFGGPYVSLAPHDVRGACDVLVTGEIEEIASDLFRDLASGSYREEYKGTRVDMTGPLIPRWDLYENERIGTASVQTSRGCPFECEFCDVIQYVGRKQRHKPIEGVVQELDQLYELGHRAVFLADDNLTVFRKRAKKLLFAIGEWNRSKPEHTRFTTQISIECTEDAEMLDLVAASGLDIVFIGIESPSQEALAETKKRQNVGVDMVERVERLARRGVMVTSGAIVGFDQDGPDIFQRQLEFAQKTPIAIVTANPLFAADGTPLRDRMEKAGRLLKAADQAMAQLSTNMIPAKMSLQELNEGLLWLLEELYSPENFGARLARFIHLHPGGEPTRSRRPRAIELEMLGKLHGMRRNDSALAQVWDHAWDLVKTKVAARPIVITTLMMYAQALHIVQQAKNAPRGSVVHPQAQRATSSQRSLPVL